MGPKKNMEQIGPQKQSAVVYTEEEDVPKQGLASEWPTKLFWKSRPYTNCFFLEAFKLFQTFGNVPL